MKKWIASKDCSIITKAPGMNTAESSGWQLHVGAGEALILPDDCEQPAKYFFEALITKKDESFMNKNVFHLTADQAS